MGHFAECCTRQRTPLSSAMVTALGKAGKMGARKTIFPSLPSVMTMVLGKEFFFKKKFKLCRVPARGHSAKNFFLKKIQTLPSAGQGALGKEFLEKKIKHLCQGPDRGHSAKNFFKKIKTLCRVPVGLALDKATVNGAGAVTVAFLCQVPPGLSAKPLPSAR